MKQLQKSAFLAAAMCVLLAVTLTASTFAWFTVNGEVETSRVTGKTGTEEIKLLISSTESFTDSQEAEITQVNQQELTELMPVSTSDLQTFFTCTAYGVSEGETEGYATGFSEVEEEEGYYHGRVYLKADGGVSVKEGERFVALYLDESEEAGGPLGEKEGDSLLLNAARLGLTFGEDKEKFCIFKLSEEENAGDKRRANTKLDGSTLGDDQVLSGSGDTPSSAEDPAKLIKDFVISADSDTVPEKPLYTIEVGKSYAVDIYFYLEGCDPDCTDSVSFNEGQIHLGFFGVLSDGEEKE